MANARRCDICGEFYETPNFRPGDFDPWKNTSMIRVLRLIVEDDEDRNHHDTMHFDACEKCLQDVIDFMLARRAEKEKGE